MRETRMFVIRAFVLSVAGMLTVTAATASAANCTGERPRSGPTFVQAAENTRAFTVRLPGAYDGRTPAPVVFAFHPGGMNMAYMQAEVPVQRDWPEVIAIYPQGLAGDNGGRAGWQGRAGTAGDRDLLFFDAMMAWLEANTCFDKAKVFVWGYSAGGMISNLLACERSDTIAALVIASSRMECTPKAAKPALINHGTGDSAIPYVRAMEAALAWSKLNGCSAPPKDKTVGCFAGESCAAAPLTLCTFDGGHGYDPPFNQTAVAFLKGLAK